MFCVSLQRYGKFRRSSHSPSYRLKQLTKICSWYIWQGARFRVLMQTLHRPKHEGGWGLPNVAVKCKTLLYHTILTLRALGGRVMSDLFRFWHVPEALTNPPYASRIPTKLVHIRHFVIDMAYVDPTVPNETSKHFKRRVYNVLLRIAMNGIPPSEMRIVRNFAHTAWNHLWKNLHPSPAQDEINST